MFGMEKLVDNGCTKFRFRFGFNGQMVMLHTHNATVKTGFGLGFVTDGMQMLATACMEQPV